MATCTEAASAAHAGTAGAAGVAEAAAAAAVTPAPCTPATSTRKSRLLAIVPVLGAQCASAGGLAVGVGLQIAADVGGHILGVGAQPRPRARRASSAAAYEAPTVEDPILPNA